MKKILLLIQRCGNGILETSPYKTRSNFFPLQVEPFFKKASKYTLGCEEWYSTLCDESIAYCDNSGTYTLNLQFYVFHKSTGSFLSSFLTIFDESRRHLFLMGEFEENILTNLELITNLTTFFKCFGVFCFFCQKSYKGEGTQHRCAKVTCCFVCKRPFLKKTVYVNRYTKNIFVIQV